MPTSFTIPGIDSASPVSGCLEEIRASGARWIGRCYSGSPAKSLSPAEAQAITRAGLGIVSIWQQRGDLTEMTGLAGHRHGLAASEQAGLCGQPIGGTIYFAVDFDAVPEQLDEVLAYFEGICGAIGSAWNLGVYGSGLVCQVLSQHGLVTATWVAGTVEWRRDLAWDSWQIRQGHSAEFRGVPFEVDIDEARGNYGAWQVPGVRAHSQPGPPLSIESSVRALQSALASGGFYLGRVDGLFGPKSEAALTAWYRRRGVYGTEVRGLS